MTVAVADSCHAGAMATTLITGATRGLGYETARRLAEVGHTVYLGARNSARGRRAAAAIGATRVLSAFAPLLEAAGTPVVVNVSSAVGSLTLNAKSDARWSTLAYPMSKAGLNMLTVQYARAYPRWRVKSVTPGLTATEFAPAAKAGHPVAEGAEVLVRMASIGVDGPTGSFLDINGTVPW